MNEIGEYSLILALGGGGLRYRGSGVGRCDRR